MIGFDKEMPELKWNEYEFIECLGVLPEVDDYSTKVRNIISK